MPGNVNYFSILAWRQETGSHYFSKIAIEWLSTWFSFFSLHLLDKKKWKSISGSLNCVSRWSVFPRMNSLWTQNVGETDSRRSVRGLSEFCFVGEYYRNLLGSPPTCPTNDRGAAFTSWIWLDLTVIDGFLFPPSSSPREDKVSVHFGRHTCRELWRLKPVNIAFV